MRVLRWMVTAGVCAVAGSMASAHLKVGDTMPAFTARTFDDQKILSDQLKGQVVVVNLWATWCVPCRQELPLLDAYYRIHAREGLRILAFATEDSVPDYVLRKLSAVMAFPLARRMASHGFDVLQGVPTNYVIDRSGVVRYADANAFTPEMLDRIIGPLLAEPAPASPSTASASTH